MKELTNCTTKSIAKFLNSRNSCTVILPLTMLFTVDYVTPLMLLSILRKPIGSAA